MLVVFRNCRNLARIIFHFELQKVYLNRDRAGKNLESLAGRGKRPNKARQLSEEEEEILWKSEKLGGKTPESLIHTMWWLLTQQFGLRGRREHHGMRLEDFRIMKGDDGLEFVEFAEGPTKTRPGGLNAKPRQFQPKMFQTGGERCLVALFRQYINRRPRNLRASGPFYLSIKYNSGPSDETWYKVQPMGENKINSMMKNIISQTSLQSSEKRFTNHSARKTLVSKMKKANLERSSIAKVTGRRNIQSLDDYDEANAVLKTNSDSFRGPFQREIVHQNPCR